MKNIVICLLLTLVGYAFAEPIGLSDYFKVEFEEIEHWGDHSRFDSLPGPNEIVQGDTVVYKVRVENVLISALPQTNVTVQLTFPNMWVNPPEIPRLFCDFIGGGVVGDLPHTITDITDNYAIWTFNAIPRTAARTIICTLQVKDDICGTVVNDLNFMAFAQVTSAESEPTITADLSDGLILKCRPGLRCSAVVGEVAVISNRGGDISVSSGDPLYIELSASNYPYNAMDANNCLFYVLLPPENIATYQSASPTPGGIRIITGGFYNNWRLIWWDVNLAFETESQVTVYFDENNGTLGDCFNALAGVLWDPDPDILWNSATGEPVENALDHPGLGYICEQTLRWCLLTPDLTISISSPYADSDCLPCDWPVNFSWTVSNEGSGIANAHTLTIEFYSGDILIQTEQIVDFVLEVGQSLSGTSVLENSECGDLIYLSAVVDVHDVVDESEETNNTAYDTLCIGITAINVNIFQFKTAQIDSAIDNCDDKRYTDCDSGMAYIAVTDQHGFPIRGLADDCWNNPHSEWVSLTKRVSGSWRNLSPLTPYSMFEVNDDIMPLSVSILMDYSESMDPTQRTLAETSVKNYIDSDLCADRFSIIKFGSDVQVKCDLSDDPIQINSALLSAYTGRGGTNILGAVQVALNQIEDDLDGFRHIVIVFSDGRDGSSIPMSSIINRANMLNTRVFTIGLGSSVDEGYLESLADGTGGLYRKVSSADEMEQLYLYFCNISSINYTLHYKTDWGTVVDMFDTLAAEVVLQNSNTFGIRLSDEDTSEYRVCAPVCDLEVTKISYGLPIDDNFGLPYAEAGVIYNYRISVTNLGNSDCPCDPVRIIDYLPSWAGTHQPHTISPSPSFYNDDRIEWEVSPSDILYGSNYIIEYSFAVISDQDSLDRSASPYVLNCVEIECDGDENNENNIDCDTVVINLIPDPSIICEYLANTNNWPGDTAIVHVSCPLPIIPDKWHIEYHNSCVSENIPLPFNSYRGQTLDRIGFTDAIILPQLNEGCNNGELWVCLSVEYDLLGTNTEYRDSCLLEIRRPPCRVRIDKNQINTGEIVMIEITQCDESDVKIEIINIAGDIVSEPLSENIGQGLFKFYWDGRDDSGLPVNSGVYGILVKAGDELYTFKLAVIR